MTSDVFCRAARSQDAARLAHLHNKVWQASFHRLAPANAIEQLNYAHRLSKWRKALYEPRAHQLVLLCEQDGVVVGMGAASAPSSPELGNRGEIFAVYVDPLFHRQGVGRRLITALAEHLHDRGYKGAALAVVKGNLAAARFYQSLGARPIGTCIDIGPIWKSRNIIYAWDDLTMLLVCAERDI